MENVPETVASGTLIFLFRSSIFSVGAEKPDLIHHDLFYGIDSAGHQLDVTEVFGAVVVNILTKGGVDVGEDVDLGNTVFDNVSEVVITESRATVKHWRNIDDLCDLTQSLNVKYGLNVNGSFDNI